MYECSSRQEPNYPVIISLEACDEWTSNTFVKNHLLKTKTKFSEIDKEKLYCIVFTEENVEKQIEPFSKLKRWVDFDLTGKFFNICPIFSQGHNLYYVSSI